MRPNLLSLTPNPRLLQPREADEVGGGGEEEGVVVVVVVVRPKPQISPDIRERSILICQKVNGPGVVTISGSGNQHTFVLNQHHVRGKTCMWPDLRRKIEKLTSSAVI